MSMDCCDREIMGYVATTGGICADTVWDLMVEAIETRIGLVGRVSERIQWHFDNQPDYVARETQNFVRMMGRGFYNPVLQHEV